MGILSDVGIALKTDAVAILADISFRSSSVLDWLEKNSDERKTADTGELYVFRNWKWYTTDNPEIETLYDALAKLDNESFLVVEACFDYPSDDCDAGSWLDNPWGLRRNIEVSLNINE